MGKLIDLTVSKPDCLECHLSIGETDTPEKAQISPFPNLYVETHSGSDRDESDSDF